MGQIYLPHFKTPYKHAKHYIGYTSQSVKKRIAQHRAGEAARLMAVVVAAGIDFDVAFTCSGNRGDERRLKNRGGASRICPICKERGTNVT